MGLFTRKSAKINTDGDLGGTNGTRHSNSAMKSPPPTKIINGTSFSSPSMPDVRLPAPPNPALDPAAYLRSIYSVRERTRLVYQRAKRNQLKHFDVDGSKFRDTADYIVSIIKVGRPVPLNHISYTELGYRGIMLQTTTEYQLTADGSILRLEVDPESIS